MGIGLHNTYLEGASVTAGVPTIAVTKTSNGSHVISITKSSTGSGNVLSVSNGGTGKCIYMQQNGDSEAVLFDQNAERIGLRVRKISTGSATAFAVINAGTGHGFFVQQNGEGRGGYINSAATSWPGLSIQSNYIGLNLNNAGTGEGLLVVQSGEGTGAKIQKTATGSDHCLILDNQGGGMDVISNQGGWYVDSVGNASFDNVEADGMSVCPGMTPTSGFVWAQNTAIAGGRVHIWSDVGGIRGAAPPSPYPHEDTWCDWGVSKVYYNVSSPLGLPGVVQIDFEQEIHCPVVKVHPWLPGEYTPGGYYGPDQIVNWGIIGPASLESNSVAFIPGINPGCYTSVLLSFTYCLWGPGAQDPYIVGEDQGTYSDLVFDFEVLGCPCEEAPLGPPV